MPLFTQGQELVQALTKAFELTVRVYYGDSGKSVYDVNNFFKSELGSAAKDLLSANYWDYLTDTNGEWAAAEAEYPLTVSKP